MEEDQFQRIITFRQDQRCSTDAHDGSQCQQHQTKKIHDLRCQFTQNKADGGRPQINKEPTSNYWKNTTATTTQHINKHHPASNKWEEALGRALAKQINARVNEITGPSRDQGTSNKGDKHQLAKHGEQSYYH
jgi:hypothetical protein